MSMCKKKLLILCQSQWGYHIDTYKYASYLKDEFNVSYLCWDYGKKIIDSDEVVVRYISRKGGVLLRNLRYLYSVILSLKKSPPDVCFIKYFTGCSLVKLLYWEKLFIFDIRTGSVKKNILKRNVYDKFMLFEAKLFNYVTVISVSLAKKLKIKKNIYILPLGSEVIAANIKKFDQLKLIYVGTLNGRNIFKTIEGLSIYLNKYKYNKNIVYTVVGDGNDMEKIKNYVRKFKLKKKVNVVGEIPFSELESFMESHNVGVSFVPKTDYFECQPVTKTFDYLLSGMPVIATSTHENLKIIKCENGVCINDDPESFSKGIHEIYSNRLKYNSNKIRENARKYDWKYVVDDLGKYINICLKEHASQ